VPIADQLDMQKDASQETVISLMGMLVCGITSVKRYSLQPTSQSEITRKATSYGVISCIHPPGRKSLSTSGTCTPNDGCKVPGSVAKTLSLTSGRLSCLLHVETCGRLTNI
jgi:hypothetical protein